MSGDQEARLRICAYKRIDAAEANIRTDGLGENPNKKKKKKERF